MEMRVHDANYRPTSLLDHAPAGGVARLPRDAAAVECGDRPDDLESPVLYKVNSRADGVSYVSERSRLPVDPTRATSTSCSIPTARWCRRRSTRARRRSAWAPRSTISGWPSGRTCSTRWRTRAFLTCYPWCPTAPHSIPTPTSRSTRRAQGRTPPSDALHPDRADRHQPDRDVRRHRQWARQPAVPASPAGIRGDTR